MALRLRRGLDLDRVGVVFAEGELVYTTDTKRLHIGDGVTAGGIPAGDLLGDTSPQLGGTLDLNTHDIVGIGQMSIEGDISSAGTILANTIIGNFKGTFSADDSTILIDGINNKLVLSNNELNDLSDVNLSSLSLSQFLKWSGTEWENNYVTLSDLSDVTIAGVPAVGQVLKYDGAGWVPADDLTISGVIVGDLKGSVFGDDSTVLVDSVRGILNLSRNELADLSNIDTAAPTNNQVLAWNGIRWTPTDLGSIQLNYLTGDVKGSVFGDDSTVLVDGVNKKINLSNNTLDNLQDVELSTLKLGDILSWNGFNWVPEGGIGEIRETDIQGSVYGADSTILVDAETSTVTANTITADTITANTITADTTNFIDNYCNYLFIDTTSEAVRLNMTRTNTGVLRGTSTFIGAMRFSATDDNETFATAYLLSYVDRVSIGHHTTSTATSIDSDGYITISNGNLTLGQGTQVGTERLDVTGNGKFTGFVQFGSYTTAERDDLTTTNTPQYATNWGMVIYNTDTNKFQGWQNTGGITPEWVDLS